MSDPTGKQATYQVVQWATGNIGTKSLQGVIGHPEMDLAGLYVTSEAKEGRDAGELAGLEPTGVLATRDVADILALRPDCVLYMQQGVDIDVLCSLLEAGINVVTTAGTFHHPPSMDPDVRRRVEDACARGGASIHSTGSSPGFISEAVTLVMVSLQRRLDRLHIGEFADVSSRNSPELLFEIMGFGKDPAEFDAARWSFGADSFGPSLRLLGDAIGMPIDSVTSDGGVAVANRTLEIAAGTISQGTVAAQRMNVSGWHEGRELLGFSATWFCSSEVDADWDFRQGGWRMVIEGDAPLDVEVRLDIPLERMAETTPGYTANRAVNAVPMVCEAAPGIRTTVDLPQIIPHLGASA